MGLMELRTWIAAMMVPQRKPRRRHNRMYAAQERRDREFREMVDSTTAPEVEW